MNEKRTEFSNLAVVAVILKSFCKPFLMELEENYPTPEDKLEGVRNAASDEGNDEIVAICNYLEKNNLIETFFPSIT